MTAFLRPTVLSVLALIMLFVAILVTRMPPSLQSLETSNGLVFDGGSALTVFERMLPNNRPHPAGSVENALMRDRLLGELRALGYEPRVQSAFSCSSIYPSCAPVENIVAVHEGRETGNALAYVGHYDSQMSGPGAADDMTAVVVMLELARLVKERPQTKNDIVFVFTDAEEKGLLGAEAFVQSDALVSQIGLVVNMEARGASGRAVLFETSENNTDLLSQLRPMMSHPTGTSLFHAIYKMLPNDTDYSVFRAAGVPGVNFAFTGSPSLYHSTFDDLVHLDKGSLQHHGQNALDLLNGFGDAELTFEADEDSVFFDVFGDLLVAWPMSWSWGFLFVSGAMIVSSIFLLSKQDRLSWSGIGLGVVIWAIAGAATLAGGYLLAYPIGKWANVTGIDHAEPSAARASLLLMGVLVAVGIGRYLLPRVQAINIAISTWSVWLVFAFVMQMLLPGGVFLFLVPVLVFSICVLIVTLRPELSPNWCFVPSMLVVSYFGLSAIIDLEVVVNFNMAFVHAVPLVLMVTSLMIVVRSDEGGPTWILPMAGAGVATATVLALFSASVTPDRPAGLNIVQFQDMDLGHSFVLAENSPFFPAENPAFEGFALDTEWRFPWGKPRRGQQFQLRSSAPLQTLAFEMDIIGEEARPGGRRVTVRLKPGADVSTAAVYVRAGNVEQVTAEGQKIDLGRRGVIPAADDIVALTLNGLYGREVSLSLDLVGSDEVELIVASKTSGVIGDGLDLVAARPAVTAQVHQGDHQLQVRRVKL
jgi:hypothetical protein